MRRAEKHATRPASVGAENGASLALAYGGGPPVATKEAGQVPRIAIAVGLHAWVIWLLETGSGANGSPPMFYCILDYSAASSSVSPSWRIISRARSASS